MLFALHAIHLPYATPANRKFKRNATPPINKQFQKTQGKKEDTRETPNNEIQG